MQACTALLIAVEDDEIIIGFARFSPGDEQLRVEEMGPPFSVSRDISDQTGVQDDQGALDVPAVVKAAKAYCEEHGITPDCCAVSSFGNVDIATGVISYVPHGGIERGQIMQFDFPTELKRTFGVSDDKIYVENDATAAALGEFIWGAGKSGDGAQPISDFAFVWLGRGINVGLVQASDVLRGRQHPEAGHAYGRLHDEDRHRGNCPIHTDCFIGVASLRSIFERRALDVDEYDLTDIIAYYLAQICVNTTNHTAPQKIAIGGYTMRKNIVPDLLPSVRRYYKKMMGIYPNYSAMRDPKNFIVEASVGPEASIFGLMEITRRKLSLAQLQS
jgi:fructokinase